MDFTKQYLTHSEYTQLGGTLPESAFNLLEHKARKKIDKRTYGRLINLDTQIQDVKLCVFDLIPILNENNSTILSESVDGYAITLMDKKELNKAIKNVIEEYLSECKLEDGTPYLYCGETRRTIVW